MNLKKLAVLALAGAMALGHAAAQTNPGQSPLSIAKGGTNATTAATARTSLGINAALITSLCNPFSSSAAGCVGASGGGTANFLRADGTWATPVTPANPAGSVGLSAGNGSAATYMRSDAAPALSSSVQTSLTGTNHNYLLGTGSVGVRSASPGSANTVMVSGGTSADPSPTTATAWFDSAYCSTIGYLIVRFTGSWTCVQGMPADPVWWGADKTGAADSSAAFNSAVTAADYVRPSCGTYKINLTITNKSYFTFDGERCVKLIQNSTSSNLITVAFNNNGGSALYKNFTAFGTNTGTGSGLYLQVTGSGGGNVQFDNIIVNGFPIYNVACVGLNTAISSGNKLTNSVILYATSENVHWEWCTDSVVSNNSIGGQAAQYTVPSINVNFSNASANLFTGNFVYDAGVGVQMVDSFYNYVLSNRMTQAGTVGFNCSNCDYLTFVGNQLYQNSNTVVGAHASAELFDADYVTISGNLFYDWLGVSRTSYSIVLDGNCSFVNVVGNVLANNATGGINSFATSSRITDNIGYNPVGVTAATSTGTTGATITAGSSRETHYIRQSATFNAAVTIGGNAICTVPSANVPCVIELGPSESYAVAWTTTQPTYTKYVH